MNDEATIRTSIGLWLEQYNSHNAAGLAAWYTSESVYLTPTGVALTGPDEVRQYFEESFKRSPNTTITAQVEQVRMDRPDQAMARGTFEVGNVLDQHGRPMGIPMRGPWVSTFAKREDRWIPLTHASSITLESFVPVRV